MKRMLAFVLAALMVAFGAVLVGCNKEWEVVPTYGNTTDTTDNEITDNTSTTIPVTTTTKPVATTTTTVHTTDKNDIITEQMMSDAKCLEYFVEEYEELLISSDDEASYRMIKTYKEYNQFIVEMNIWKQSLEEFGDSERLDSAFSEYNKSFFNEYALLLIEIPSPWQPIRDISIEDICLNGSNLNVYIYINAQGALPDNYAGIFFVKVPKDVEAKIENINITIEKEPWDGMIYKPVIYLYPEEETEACVKLGFEDKVTVSYPYYVDGWNVIAKPDGKLVYTETGRNLYSLYYESELVEPFRIERDGFVVRGESVAQFLEEKLAILGLNEYEAQEFIIYWLPILQANEYNYIRFATTDEIERNMPLEINPNPDSVIRVWMTFAALDESIDVQEQQLTVPDRTGFVAVEWGGTQIIG